MKRGDGADIDGVKGRFTGGIINDPDRIGTNIITKKKQYYQNFLGKLSWRRYQGLSQKLFFTRKMINSKNYKNLFEYQTRAKL